MVHCTHFSYKIGIISCALPHGKVFFLLIQHSSAVMGALRDIKNALLSDINLSKNYQNI